MNQYWLVLIAVLVLTTSCNQNKNSIPQDAYLFYYFEGKAGERAGLHSAYSYDLHTWHQLKDSMYAPAIGEWKVFRDPCVTRTDDGMFHLVWTCGKSGFGYASSPDGVNWDNDRFIEVWDTTRGIEFANVWAPEFFIENDSVYIIWSSTLMDDYIPPKDPEKWWTSKWNHRFYLTSTTDFKTFSPTRKFYDFGFNTIDAVVHKTDSLYYLFFKDERKISKNVMIASSKYFEGPYTDTTDITYKLTEGAITVQTDTALVLYYDYYHEYNGYRYMTTKDMVNWTNEIIPEKAGFDNVIRHGSIVKVTNTELETMLK